MVVNSLQSNIHHNNDEINGCLINYQVAPLHYGHYGTAGIQISPDSTLFLTLSSQLIKAHGPINLANQDKDYGE